MESWWKRPSRWGVCCCELENGVLVCPPVNPSPAGKCKEHLICILQHSPFMHFQSDCKVAAFVCVSSFPRLHSKEEHRGLINAAGLLRVSVEFMTSREVKSLCFCYAGSTAAPTLLWGTDSTDRHWGSCLLRCRHTNEVSDLTNEKWELRSRLSAFHLTFRLGGIDRMSGWPLSLRALQSLCQDTAQDLVQKVCQKRSLLVQNVRGRYSNCVSEW